MIIMALAEMKNEESFHQLSQLLVCSEYTTAGRSLLYRSRFSGIVFAALYIALQMAETCCRCAFWQFFVYWKLYLFYT
jgi:hypothetical protein